MSFGFGFSIATQRAPTDGAGAVESGDVFVPIGARGRGLPGTGPLTTGAANSFNGQNIFWNLADTPAPELKVVYVDWEMSAAGLVAKAAGAVFNDFSLGLNYQQSSQGDFAFNGNLDSCIAKQDERQSRCEFEESWRSVERSLFHQAANGALHHTSRIPQLARRHFPSIDDEPFLEAGQVG
jgi:hypothetical protein